MILLLTAELSYGALSLGLIVENRTEKNRTEVNGRGQNMALSTRKQWTMRILLLFSFTVFISVVLAKRVNPLLDVTKETGGVKHREEHYIQPSLSKIVSINSAGRFSLTSMAVQHRSSGSWYLPHLHDKYSAGWNRTVRRI